jgi:hypothetical protein
VRTTASVADRFVGVAGTDPLVQAPVGGVVIAATNTAGATPVAVWRDPGQRWVDAAPGSAVGGTLFVVSEGMLPGSHADGTERFATMGTMSGAMGMLPPDVALAEVPPRPWGANVNHTDWGPP